MRALALALVGMSACGPIGLHPSMTPDAIVTVTTDDRWDLDLRHYEGDGPPVVLVHGMGANHYNWDFREEVSLAAYLRDHGWDVWVPELRGEEGSRAPSRKAKRSFTFDDYAVHDIPAIVEEVLERTETDSVYWVGHSMGGLLLYTYLASRPDQVAAGVTIGSPADFTVGLRMHRTASHTLWMWRGNGVIPSRNLARMMPPFGRAHPILPRLANPRNMDGPATNGLAWYALENVRRPVARQAITWLKARELVRTDGTPWLRPGPTPLMLMAGIRDRVVAHDDVHTTCDLFPDCQFVSLSEANGFSSDYGHVDPLLGKTSITEVYPLILEYLNAQRAMAEALVNGDRDEDVRVDEQVVDFVVSP